MVQFTMSAYDENDKCKICGAHMSEYHREGCELGETKKELKTAGLIIEQFRNLLEVETTTSGFEKAAELMGKGRPTMRAPDLKPACPTCKDTGSVEYPCPNCRLSKTASSG